jgi:hypothetical protein
MTVLLRTGVYASLFQKRRKSSLLIFEHLPLLAASEARLAT